MIDVSELSDYLAAGARRGVPRHTLLARALRSRLATGALRPGDRLPSVRWLAAALRAHPRVVAAAYAELRAEGVLEGRSGAGTLVARPGARGDAARLAHLASLADDVVATALAEGFPPEAVEAAVATSVARLRVRRRTEEERLRLGRRTLLLAGSHDLSLEVLVALVGTGRHPVRLVPSFCGSLAGLIRLAGGAAHLAAVHLVDPATGVYNTSFVQRVLGGRAARLVLVAEREQGLLLAPGNPLAISGVPDLRREGIRLANRQGGSGTRALLDLLLQQAAVPAHSVAGYQYEHATHLDVAQAVARGDADVGLGIEAAARVHGLAFIPVAREPFELVMLEELSEAPPFRRIREALKTPEFGSAVAALGGYDTRRSGLERVVPAAA